MCSSFALQAAETIDPGDTNSQYAWSENSGWLNTEPMGQDGPGMDIRPDSARGWLWAENLGWISLNCVNTKSCDKVVFGVTVAAIDGKPDNYTMSGYAWGENIGWISLSCENTASCEQVNYGIELADSGALSGFAWSENVGWISFNCLNTSSCGAVDYSISTDLPSLLLFNNSFEDI